MCQQKGMSQNIHLKVMKRAAPQQTQVYEISVCAQIEILYKFISERVPLYIQAFYGNSPLRRKL